MKRRLTVIGLCLLCCFFLLLTSCSELHWKDGAAEGKQGFRVQIAPNGEVVQASYWDGKPLEYDPEEKKRILGAKLGFFVPKNKKHPDSYLKKINGKWKKEKIQSEKLATLELKKDRPHEIRQINQRVKSKAVDDGILVLANGKGHIQKIEQCNGSKPDYDEPIEDFKNSAVFTINTCCWGLYYGRATCHPNYCPW